jgi:hypothetical protein
MIFKTPISMTKNKKRSSLAWYSLANPKAINTNIPAEARKDKTVAAVVTFLSWTTD